MAYVVIGRDSFGSTEIELLDGRSFESGTLELVWRTLRGNPVADGGVARLSTANLGIAIPGNLEPSNQHRGRLEFDATQNSPVGIVVELRNDGHDYLLALFQSPRIHLFRISSGVATWVRSEDVSDNLTVTSQLWFFANGGGTYEIWWNGAPKILHSELTGYEGVPGLYLPAMGPSIDAFDIVMEEADNPATVAPVTEVPTSTAPTTEPPATTAPTATSPEPTMIPTTPAPPTTVPSTEPPLTETPTTLSPTTEPPATLPPLEIGDGVRCGFSYVEIQDQLVTRAWIVSENGSRRTSALVAADCRLELIDELGHILSVTGCEAPSSSEARFVVPQSRLYSEHLYLARVTLKTVGEDAITTLVALPVN